MWIGRKWNQINQAKRVDYSEILQKQNKTEQNNNLSVVI